MTSMSVEEYFAEAADRLQGGEAVERIIADYPLEVRAELQALLAIVELAEQVAAIAPPQPLPLNRIAARISFAQRAAELRAEFEASQNAPGAANTVVSSQPAITAHTTRRQERPQTWWRQFVGFWTAPTPAMRFAPLALLLAMIYVLTSTIVVAAKESLPGNPVYPVRVWMLEQGVATAPVQQKAEARWLVDRALAGDVARLAEQLQATPDAAPVSVESIQQFRGFDEDLLLIGDLRVIPWHQPADIGPDDWFPITIEGTLEPGATVLLRYQVVPGAANVVQGVELTVLQSPAMPTPQPTPTSAPVTGVHCQRIQAPNWIAYIVKPGESLSDIAMRSQTSVTELRRVNCLTDGSVRAGTTIFVPMTILGRVPSAPPPALATAIPTPVIPPTPTPAPFTPTNTPSPPTSAPTLAPTSESASPESTALPPSETETPVQSATPAAPSTPTQTAAPTESDVTAIPLETEPPIPATATPIQTEQTESSPTPSPTAEGGSSPAEAPSPTATASNIEPPTAAPVESAATPTPLNTTAPTAPPTMEPSPTLAESAGGASVTSTLPPTATPPPPTATPVAASPTNTPVAEGD